MSDEEKQEGLNIISMAAGGVRTHEGARRWYDGRRHDVRHMEMARIARVFS
jgi:hypothetical protein